MMLIQGVQSDALCDTVPHDGVQHDGAPNTVSHDGVPNTGARSTDVSASCLVIGGQFAPSTDVRSTQMPDTIQAIGGYGAQKLVIGGRTKFEHMDKRDKWVAHKKYGKKEFTIDTVNEILVLPEYIDDKNLLIEVLTKIWNSPSEQIVNGIAKSTGLDEPLVVAYRTLFWKLKELVETVVLLYLKYIHNYDIKQMLAKWKRYVHKHNIDTSSVILWMLFGRKSKIYPPKIKEHKLFANLNFDYLGFCPNAPAERICALMEFPVDKLMRHISKKTEININFTKVIDSIISINKSKPTLDVAKCKKSKIKTAKNFYTYIDKFMEVWLDFHDCIYPYLEEVEEHYIDSAKKIDKTSKVLDGMIGKLLKQL